MTGVVDTDTSRDSEDSPRVYSPYSKYAHNTWDTTGKRGSCIYCKRPAPASGWKGTETEYQRRKALSLPYCKERE